MIVEYLTISFDTIFRIFMGRMSGPDAFKGFKLLSNFSLPGTVNNMSGTVETVGVQRFSLFYWNTAFFRFLLYDVNI